MAATGGLFVTAVVGAPVSVVLLPFVPLPGLLLGGRHGAGALAACVALTTLVAAALLGPGPALTYMLTIGGPTLAAAAALRRAWSVERTVLLGAGAWSLAVAVLLLVTYGSPNLVLEGLRERLQESFDLAVSASGRFGMEPDAASDLLAMREPMLAGILGILPGVLVLAGGFTMLLNVLIVRSLLPWLQLADLRTWSVPAALIWGFIGAGFGMFAPLPEIALVARNAFVMLLGCYLCQGLAVISFFLAQFQVRRSLRVASYVLIATQQVLLAVVLLLGIFDLWANFRRLGVILSNQADD